MVSVLKASSLILSLSCCCLGRVTWSHLISASLVLQPVVSCQFSLDCALSVSVTSSFLPHRCLSPSQFVNVFINYCGNHWKVTAEASEHLSWQPEEKILLFLWLSFQLSFQQKAIRLWTKFVLLEKQVFSLPLNLVFFLNTSDKRLWLVVLLWTNGPAPYLKSHRFGLTAIVQHCFCVGIPVLLVLFLEKCKWKGSSGCVLFALSKGKYWKEYPTSQYPIWPLCCLKHSLSLVEILCQLVCSRG